jgi:predicted RNA-binding Zn-ribbon protein involved in translation (DUF1610 family)
MAKCTLCGYEVEVAKKSWEIHPKKRPKAPRVRISQYVCPKCGTHFREYKKVE